MRGRIFQKQFYKNSISLPLQSTLLISLGRLHRPRSIIFFIKSVHSCLLLSIPVYSNCAVASFQHPPHAMLSRCATNLHYRNPPKAQTNASSSLDSHRWSHGCSRPRAILMNVQPFKQHINQSVRRQVSPSLSPQLQKHPCLTPVLQRVSSNWDGSNARLTARFVLEKVYRILNMPFVLDSLSSQRLTLLSSQDSRVSHAAISSGFSKSTSSAVFNQYLRVSDNSFRRNCSTSTKA